MSHNIKPPQAIDLPENVIEMAMYKKGVVAIAALVITTLFATSYPLDFVSCIKILIVGTLGSVATGIYYALDHGRKFGDYHEDFFGDKADKNGNTIKSEKLTGTTLALLGFSYIALFFSVTTLIACILID